MPRKKEPTKEQQAWAHRYEAAWHECFWRMPEFKQVQVIENPLEGKWCMELAKSTRLLAEDDSFKPKKNYRDIPTTIDELKEKK